MQVNNWTDAEQNTDIKLDDGTNGPFSDLLDLAKIAGGFVCNAAGNLKLRTYGGINAPGGQTTHDITLAVLPGVVYRIRARRFYATGTTVAAAGMIALYDSH